MLPRLGHWAGDDKNPFAAVARDPRTKSLVTMVTPDIDRYLVSISPHATTQLALQQRTLSTLQGLRYDDEASRRSTAAVLETIQTELSQLAAALTAVRAPERLAASRAPHARSIEQLASASGELAEALTGESAMRLTRVERALGLARDAETLVRASTDSIHLALGSTTDVPAAGIPVIGLLIVAILAVIAAIIVVIAAILAKGKEQEAAEKEREDSDGTPHPDRWPP